MDLESGGPRLRLEPRPDCVGEARRLVRRALIDSGHENLIDSAALAVSELVTNALVHAGTPIELSVRILGDGIRVEIADGSPHLPSPRGYAVTAGTGRGLVMVQELVDDWGAEPCPDGKVVWFQLGCGPRAEARDDLPVPVPSIADDGVLLIEMVNFPLLLHVAWQQHAEALLREHLLFSLDVENAEDALQAHAHASDALAILAEHLPQPELGIHPEQVMAAAVDPELSSFDASVPVPVESVPHFAALGRSMDQAVQSADQGLYLTPVMQPELRMLRRWICRQVQRQSQGMAPEPWVAEREPPAAAVKPVVWDASPVAEAVGEVIAADDANRILAVSRSALELLGYDDAAQLVGRRLLRIIPPRYHQAHQAGFTLHVYTGRSPLLHRTVTVPVLCADGSETLVDLTVHAHQLQGGRAVFTADLRPAGRAATA
ncbi:MAG: ATP-binding protein [Nocardioidaceae bacterium]